jgi:hypothetical protein
MKRTTVKRTTEVLALGIYRDRHGITIMFRPAGAKKPIRERSPLCDAKGIPYTSRHCSELVIRRAQLIEDYRNGRIGNDAGAPGSLRRAIDAFVDSHPIAKTADGKNDPDDRTNADLHSNLKHWTTGELASMQVTAIRRADIARVLDAWTEAGAAASSVNRRKRALADVLRIELEKKKRAGDDDVILPTERIPDVPPPNEVARGVPIPILLGILGEMPDQGRATKDGKRPKYSETKIRIGVMIWSGMAHASLRRLPSTSVRWSRQQVQLPARRKGKRGVPAVWVDALPPLMEWLRRYDAANLWGKSFSNSSMHSSWARAVARRRAKLQAAAKSPDATQADRTLWEEFRTTVRDDCHPYDARHSFLTEIVSETGDVTGAMQLGQIKTDRVIRRYTKHAVPKRAAAAIAALRTLWAPDAANPPARDFALVEKAE